MSHPAESAAPAHGKCCVQIGLDFERGCFCAICLEPRTSFEIFLLVSSHDLPGSAEKPTYGRNAKSLYNARSILVGERLKAEPEIRFREYQESLVSSESGLRRSARIQSNQDFELHLSNEIMRQVHEGYISRASSLASSPGLARPREATAQILRNLWNQEPHRPTSPWTAPSNLVRTNIKSAIENTLSKSLRTAAKGSGAGLSGWRFEYLFSLLF